MNKDAKKIKIVTVVGTRPEIIKLAETIKELDAHTQHILVHSGQNYDYELNEIFFKDLGLRKPDYFLEATGKTAAETVGNVIAKADAVLEKEKPDAFLVLGDTNSCLAAYAAKRRKIPIFHMEAGNRCFDMRVPEDINRRIIDHISDINLVYSERARENLIREGFPSERIIKSGSPMLEVFLTYRKKIESSDVLAKLGLEKQKYFVLSSHREENIASDRNFKRLITLISLVSERYNMPIVFSVHPRTQKRMDAEGVVLPKNVKALKPLGLFDYVKLQTNATCVITDSGTISEESSILNFPAINIREAHERLEAMDEGTVMMTGLNPDRVLEAIEIARTQKRGDEREFLIVKDYETPNVSKKILRIIISYTDYIKQKVWFEFD